MVKKVKKRVAAMPEHEKEFLKPLIARATQTLVIVSIITALLVTGAWKGGIDNKVTANAEAAEAALAAAKEVHTELDSHVVDFQNKWLEHNEQQIKDTEKLKGKLDNIEILIKAAN